VNPGSLFHFPLTSRDTAFCDIFYHLLHSDRLIFTKLFEIIDTGKATSPLHLAVVSDLDQPGSTSRIPVGMFIPENFGLDYSGYVRFVSPCRTQFK